MKHMRHWLMTVAVLLCSVASARVEIDGICYNLYSETKQAEVTAGYTRCSGSITIPATVTHEDVQYSVTSIEGHAFDCCNSLTSITIPESVTSIGESAFYGCTFVQENFINKSTCTDSNYWGAIIADSEYDGVLVKDGSVIDCRPYVTTVTLPEGVTSIGEYAFYSCSSLTDITIPECVTSIGENAFWNCPIVSINIPAGVANIGFGAFVCPGLVSIVVDEANAVYDSREACNAIIEKNLDVLISGCKTTTIPEDVVAIADFAFCCCEFTSISIPSGVSYIGIAAFGGCSSLTSITCRATKPPYIMDGAFDGVPRSIPIYVPASSVEAYKSANGWEEFSYIQPIIDEVEYKNTLLVENQDARAGTQVELSIALKNNVNITNFQFDLVLPEGITIAQDEDGYDLIDLSTVRTTVRKHTIGNELQNDGSMRVVCYSSSNAVFSGTEGEVMTVKLNISKSLSEGEYCVQLKNLVLTEYTDGNATKHTIPCVESKINVHVYTPGDVNDDGSIDVTDISGVVSFILNTATSGLIERAADVNEDGAVDVTDISGVVNMILNVSASKTSFSRGLLRTSSVESTNDIRLTVLPFTLKAGEEKEVQILLDNPNDAFTGVQFDLYLPKGVSVAMDDEGYYCVDLGSRTTKRNHVLPECSLLEDGGLRVVCYSSTNKIFKNEEGDILVLTIVGDESLSDDVCELSLKNIVLSRPDVTNNKPSDYEASILSGDGGNTPTLALYGIYTADVLGDFSAALSTNKSVTSIDLTEAVSVAESGVLTTGNPNTLLYLSENAALANENNVVCGDECENLVLTDGYGFSTPIAFDAVKATYTRTLPNTMWNALYLPFDVSAGALSDYDVASFSSLNLNADNSMSMTVELTDGIEANTPYIIRAKNAGALALRIEQSDVTVESESNTLSLENGSKRTSITGVYAETVASDIAGAYAISGGAFKRAASDEQVLKSFRFYLMLTENGNPIQSAALKTISINVTGAEGTTSIEDVQLDGNSETIVYDLHGRRVSNPGKGVYIVNGEKIVVK